MPNNITVTHLSLNNNNNNNNYHASENPNPKRFMQTENDQTGYDGTRPVAARFDFDRQKCHEKRH